MIKKAKVLVVEDNEDHMLTAATILKYAQYSVLKAKNGKEGVEIAKKEKPDFILMDIEMPVMDGFEALKTLKAAEATKNIPVIMLTNLGQDEDKERGKKLHAADYWVKADFTPTQVSDKIKNYIK